MSAHFRTTVSVPTLTQCVASQCPQHVQEVQPLAMPPRSSVPAFADTYRGACSVWTGNTKGACVVETHSCKFSAAAQAHPPASLPSFATTGAAPVPVPPPIPAVTKSRSAPDTICKGQTHSSATSSTAAAAAACGGIGEGAGLAKRHLSEPKQASLTCHAYLIQPLCAFLCCDAPNLWVASTAQPPSGIKADLQFVAAQVGCQNLGVSVNDPHLSLHNMASK